MIRVGISALTLVPGVVGGSEVAYRSLMREFKSFDDLAMRALVPTIAPDAGEGHASTVIRSYPASSSTLGRLRAMVTASVAGGHIRREMDLGTLDVLRFPFSTMVPPIRGIPCVSTIHDVQHEFLPEFFTRAERVYRRRIYGETARRSDLVITLSQHAARAINEKLGVSDERIRVIPLGADLTVFHPDSSTEREPFLLYPANPWPHKNHGRLFEAFAALRSRRPDLRLVLTGTGHDTRAIPPGVNVLGRVPTDTLARLYRSASVLVFPSLFEGFGMPIVEAFASGCPVAASNVGAISEVAGDAAVLFDPLDVDSISAAIERALDAPEQLSQRGLARAEKFTWAVSASAHRDVYRELAS